MENVRAIVLSLNREGEITFLNHYGQSFFGYSEMEVLGKPMLGTLTPLTGFGGPRYGGLLVRARTPPESLCLQRS
jgi:PAS domain-containing protein